ncbi:protein ANTAGONIST OF LIKE HETEROCHROMATIN PROTEIN 1-like [Salvia divinorum]|uniref:Protein ANTAGONIST OF LIKE HETEROCHROMATIN PROTEIN 1-like n=1 Tax=Salvia divinorum TaxID=28513 RepID=A0ABD1GHX8_SALDI
MARIFRPSTTIYLLIKDILRLLHMQTLTILYLYLKRRHLVHGRRRALRHYSLLERVPSQVRHLNRLVRLSDVDCFVNFRMDRNTFGKLCKLLEDVGGLKNQKFLSIEEQVAIFLGVLAYHKKSRVVALDFLRSGETVSRYVHIVLDALLALHPLLLAKPALVDEETTDPRWKYFKGCIGALDGTYINVLVSNTDKPRYRTRKGQIATNTLAACDRHIRFIYVLPGWEGSAGDSRVLRDAVSRPHGLKVLIGNYFLCDNGYANSEGFLTPYKGVGYHLKEWAVGAQKPQNPIELFNLRHTKARNVIERAFAVLKMR